MLLEKRRAISRFALSLLAIGAFVVWVQTAASSDPQIKECRRANPWPGDVVPPVDIGGSENGQRCADMDWCEPAGCQQAGANSWVDWETRAQVGTCADGVAWCRTCPVRVPNVNNPNQNDAVLVVCAVGTEFPTQIDCLAFTNEVGPLSTGTQGPGVCFDTVIY